MSILDKHTKFDCRKLGVPEVSITGSPKNGPLLGYLAVRPKSPSGFFLKRRSKSLPSRKKKQVPKIEPGFIADLS